MKVSIIGSFMSPNFGDELLLEVMVRRLRHCFGSKVSLYVPYCFEGIKKVENVFYGGGDRDLRNSDLVVFGGGGYLGESPPLKSAPKQSRRWVDNNEDFFLLKVSGLNKYVGRGIPLRQSVLSFARYHRIARECKKQEIPYVIFGAGCGPVDSIVNKYFLKGIVRYAKSVYLRDSESISASRSVLARKDVRQTFDIVLSELKEEFEGKKTVKRVAFHVGQITSDYQMNAVSNLIDHVLNNGHEVKIICDSFSEQQMVPSRKLCETKSLILSEYKGDTSLFVKEIENVDLLITTKLHAAIVAYSVGTIPISIPSHPKTRRFFNQIGMEDYCFPDYACDLSGVKAKLDEISKSTDDAIRKLNEKRVLIKNTVLDQLAECMKYNA